MDQPISEQAEQLIKNIHALIVSTQHLDERYSSKIDKMNRKMNDFAAEYGAHARLSIAEYASYLNHDALSPLTIVLGYAELFRSVNAHVLSNDELQCVNVICTQIRTLTESLREERNLMVAKRDEQTTPIT